MQGQWLVRHGLELDGCGHRLQFPFLSRIYWKSGFPLRWLFVAALADLCDLLLRSLVSGIDLGGVNQLSQSTFFVTRLQQLVAYAHMHARGSNLDPVKGCLVNQ